MIRRIVVYFILTALGMGFAMCNVQYAMPDESQLTNSPTHQLINSPIRQQTNYSTLWQKVDSLDLQGLPRSALEVVNTIYGLAKKEKNNPQFVKAVIYRIRLQSQYTQDLLPGTIRDLQNEVSSAGEPLRQLLQSILAEVYQQYFQTNLYRWRQRSEVTTVIEDSLETWDLNTLNRRIIKTYMMSLENQELLKKVPISEYQPILEIPSPENKKGEAEKYRPTLYDFLAWRALDFFAADLGPMKVSAGNFKLDKPYYFEQPANFTRLRMAIPYDSSSPESFAINILRDLVQFHLPDPDPQALIDCELFRFSFVYRKTTLESKDSLYPDALRKMEKTYIRSPWSTQVSYDLAQFMNGQGNLYQPLVSDLHKWDKKEALATCEAAVRRFPESDGAKNCRILAQEIREKGLTIRAESAIYPGKPATALARIRNAGTLFFRMIKTDGEKFSQETQSMDQQAKLAYILQMTATQSWDMSFPSDSDYQEHSGEFGIPPCDPGFYILVASSGKDFSVPSDAVTFTTLYVTRLSYISNRMKSGGYEFFILDRESGRPMKGVQAEALYRAYDHFSRSYQTRKLGDFAADNEGRLEIVSAKGEGFNNSLFLRLRYKDDLFVTGSIYLYTTRELPVVPVISTRFFTDRAIYRPGQVIYFKGIVLETTGDDNKLKTKYKTTVTLTDVNGQKVAEKELVTNDFGSFNGSFILPQGVLLGQMTISNNSGSISFSVEEYKRPTFEVYFDPLEGNYRLDDSITVKGKAMSYAGFSLDDAMVRFRVVRSARFPYREPVYYIPWLPYPDVEILNGTVKTGGDGTFTLRFPATADERIPAKQKPVFNFYITADVTDLNGETHTGETNVSVGYTSLLIGSTFPAKLDLEKDSVFKVTSTNLNGRFTPAEVMVMLEKLKVPDRAFKPRLWERPDLVTFSRMDFYAQFPDDVFADDDDPSKWPVESQLLQKTMNTASDSLVRIREFGSPDWKPGYYRLVMKAKDPSGSDIDMSSVLILFDPGSKSVPGNDINWFMPLTTSCLPGESASFLVGSKEENVNVLYEIRVHDTVAYRQWMKISKEQRKITVPVEEGYRGNFTVNFIFITHNRTFQNTQVVTVPYENRKLDITFRTFRDKLEPGQKEEWKIRITDAEKKGVLAEYLTAMYDASLDVFAPNAWDFSIYTRFFNATPWETASSFSMRTASSYPFDRNFQERTYRQYPQLNWFGFSYFGGRNIYKRGGRMGLTDRSVPVAGEPMAMDEVVEQKAETEGEKGLTEKEPASPGAKKTGFSGYQVRRDFRETAFFYPTLLSDTSGNLVVSFSLPESLTKWKMLGLAYTKDLKCGLVEKELVAQKQVMVFPNAPRFVRQGDTVVFSTKVVNLTGMDISASVHIDLSEPISGLNLNSFILNTEPGFEYKQINRKTISIPGGESRLVSWTFYIPFDPLVSLLQYQVTADAGTFSDGEQKVIPALTNRMLVTETFPLPVRGKETTDFVFRKLTESDNSGSLKNYKLTLEFASNPAWYAVQALPVLNDPDYPSADNIFNAFYANSIAFHITNTNPKIRQVFESWKNLTPDALLSNLEKNEDLKSALLQETPWVMDARTETEQKHRIALLFDLNTMSNRLNESLVKLQKLQSPGGGWPWFQGMPDNRFTTQEIVTGLGRLDHLGVTDIRKDPAVWNMLQKAIRYLDNELAEDYRNLKKYKADLDENHLGAMQVQYLYARSYFQDIPVSTTPLPPGGMAGDDRFSAGDAYAYYKGQAEKYWLKQELSCQAMIALALDRLGNKDVPQKIMRSLSEKALHSDEMGMYWTGPGGYYWYQAPVETQALMIEAYEEVVKDRGSVEDLKTWLLKQKQTQQWRSNRATAEACYALLLRGSDLLGEDPGVKIKLGKETVDPSKFMDNRAEAGTGYFRESWQGKAITPDMGKVEVSKSTEGIAWGALYWQYFEDLDKITPAQTPLKLEKKLFVERNTPRGPVLEEIPDHELQIANDNSNQQLKIGDKLKIRIILTADRDLEFVHMKDMRASAFEPVTPPPSPFPLGRGSAGEGLSGYRYQDGLGYYQSITDVSANFFFDWLPRGTYVFEYPLVVNAAGDYSNGITTIQCLYAPEYSAHSEGIRVKIQ